MITDPACLDANVVLEILAGRPYADEAVKLLRRLSGRAAVSALTAHLAHYFGSKITGIDHIRSLLADYTILPLTAEDFEWAYTNRRDDDFEDALQLAVAIRNGCKQFHTLDKGLHKAYAGLPVIDVRLVG